MHDPSLSDIRRSADLLRPFLVKTPVWHWKNDSIVPELGKATEVYLKLELFQHTGTFKPRGALRVMLDLTPKRRARGVVAVSRGNHAVAVSFAARELGCSAKVVIPKSASPDRIARCQYYGAEVILTETVAESVAKAEEIRVSEDRTLVHQYEGPLTAQGNGTLALEFLSEVPTLDCVLVPIGGGGLAAGVGAAVKQINSNCRVIGVEPERSQKMSLSFKAGSPQAADGLDSIADSLSVPTALPYSFSVCRRYLDEIVLVSDDDLRRAMLRLYQGVKLAVEPAGAATTAALIGPLRERINGRRVGAIVCGSNIAPALFCDHLARATSESSG